MSAPVTDRPTGAWAEQDPRPRWRLVREFAYGRATIAAVACGMRVRRRGDLLHLRVDGRWHAMAVVPAARRTAAGPSRGLPAARWVHFDLDLHDWFTFGRSGYGTVPVGSDWRAIRWLADADIS